MDITVTEMNEQHLEAVQAIEQSSFIAPWSSQLFNQELQLAVALSLIAAIREDGREKVIGYFCAWIVEDDCAVLRIACHPQHRRRGIGRILLQQGLTRAGARGARRASLEVRPSNESALAFYRACGFTIAGVRKGYYPETGEDALVMQLTLAVPPHGSGKQSAGSVTIPS
ncbi:MAG: ribosomal protein S18-alanine N-acetyltransferase [Proteobacteria bacterium]|nr:ribosomal protein S18-alanine N-acetyltransferase [Pseudomonadota bacterium]